MNTFQFREWWQYRRAAKGRHGVHSPFVYQFVEEGLRPSIPKETCLELRKAAVSSHQYAQAKTLYRCLKSLGVQSLQCTGQDNLKGLIQCIAKSAGVELWKATDIKAPDCIVLPANAEETERLFSENSAGLKDGLFFITLDMHASPHNMLQWLRLREDARINLSIDLWHVGLLFYRTDFKERQHFVLKYPA